MCGMDHMEIITNSRFVGIFCPEINSADLVTSIVTTVQTLEKIGKKVVVVISKDVDAEFMPKLRMAKLEISKTLNPHRYMVAIDYAKNGIEKISYDTDEVTKQVKFYITPSQGEFSFDDVVYEAQGDNIDLAILFDANSLRDMGDVYIQNESHLANSKLITISNSPDAIGDVVLAVDHNGYLKQVVNLLDSNLDPDTKNEIVMNMAQEIDLLSSSAQPSSWEAACNYANSGLDMNKFISKKYYSQSDSVLRLMVKLTGNLKGDKDNRFLYSSVTAKEIEGLNLNAQDIIVNGRLPFNISNEYDLAVAVVEVSKEKTVLLVQSNNPQSINAQTLAGVFEGTGDSGNARAEISSKDFDQVESQVWMSIKEIYGFEPILVSMS